MHYLSRPPRIFATVGKLFKGILTGRGGLIYYGLTNYWGFIELATTIPEVAEVGRIDVLYKVCFSLVPTLDRDRFLVPCQECPSILTPTPERAFVDFLRYDAVDELDEVLMIAMQRYLDSDKVDIPELLRVAEHYGVQAGIERVIEYARDWDKFQDE